MAMLSAGIACGDGTGPGGRTIRGVVSLSTVWGLPLPNDGVQVRIGTSDLVAETGDDGQWEIANVPLGTHDVHFSKPGFGPMRVPGVRMSLGTVTLEDTTYLAETPAHSAVIDSITISTRFGPPAVLVWGKITATPPDDAVAAATVVYEGTSPSVGPLENTFSGAAISSAIVNGNTGERSPPDAEFVNLVLLEEVQKRHAPGSVIYYAVYASSSSCSCYVEPGSGQLIFTNVGPRGSVASIIIP